ncbi:MAG: hypothetical protein EOP06_09280 [Proteobacteria bacterium]|nr:MAG: hypothetical protein EOP06_09280 [Pseudomonadota bacterium]
MKSYIFFLPALACALLSIFLYFAWKKVGELPESHMVGSPSYLSRITSKEDDYILKEHKYLEATCYVVTSKTRGAAGLSCIKNDLATKP